MVGALLSTVRLFCTWRITPGHDPDSADRIAGPHGLPGLRRYVITRGVAGPDGSPPAWDRSAELWFDTLEDAHAALSVAGFPAGAEGRSSGTITDVRMGICEVVRDGIPEAPQRADVRARLEALPTAAVSDALGKRGVLGTGLRRLSGRGAVCGPAVTAACGEGSLAAVMEALQSVAAGDVLCIGGPGEWAYLGEVLAAECVRRQIGGVVVDGLVRDIEPIRSLALSVYARGLTPRGARLGAAGRAQAPVELGDTIVAPGDWILGDEDGVVAVPAGAADQTTLAAQEIVAGEQRLSDAIAAGGCLAQLLRA